MLTELAQAGLVERYRRRGTFVTDGARQENLLRFVTTSLRGPKIPGRHARASVGWRGFTVPPAGLRHLHDLRRSLHHSTFARNKRMSRTAA